MIDETAAPAQEAVRPADPAFGRPVDTSVRLAGRYDFANAIDQPGQRRFALGLHICASLGDLIGAAVSIESRPGVGSTFTVELPAAPADGGARSQQGRR